MRNTYLKCYSFIYLAFLASITRLYAYEGIIQKYLMFI